MPIFLVGHYGIIEVFCQKNNKLSSLYYYCTKNETGANTHCAGADVWQPVEFYVIYEF
jgi:hypothetical protein